MVTQRCHIFTPLRPQESHLSYNIELVDLKSMLFFNYRRNGRLDVGARFQQPILRRGDHRNGSSPGTHFSNHPRSASVTPHPTFVVVKQVFTHQAQNGLHPRSDHRILLLKRRRGSLKYDVAFGY